MRTIRKTKHLVKRKSIKKRTGGSGKVNDKVLKLGIKDARGEEIFVPIKPDKKTGQLEYAEDETGIDTRTGEKLSDFAQLRTNSPLGAPLLKREEWMDFDKYAIKNTKSRGGRKLTKKRKTRKSRRKVKKSRKRARK